MILTCSDRRMISYKRICYMLQVFKWFCSRLLYSQSVLFGAIRPPQGPSAPQFFLGCSRCLFFASPHDTSECARPSLSGQQQCTNLAALHWPMQKRIFTERVFPFQSVCAPSQDLGHCASKALLGFFGAPSAMSNCTRA